MARARQRRSRSSSSVSLGSCGKRANVRGPVARPAGALGRVAGRSVAGPRFTPPQTTTAVLDSPGVRVDVTQRGIDGYAADSCPALGYRHLQPAVAPPSPSAVAPSFGAHLFPEIDQEIVTQKYNVLPRAPATRPCESASGAAASTRRHGDLDAPHPTVAVLPAPGRSLEPPPVGRPRKG